MFEIWFALEDPPARKINEVSISLDKNESRKQTDSAGHSVNVQFVANEYGRLSSIGFRIIDTHARTAFRYCYDRLSQILSFWTLYLGTGFSIAGIRIVDLSHQAKWKVVPNDSEAQPFMLPTEFQVSPIHASVLSLYREGRNSTSPFYRLLCFYKIMESWHRLGNVFGEADRIIREKGLLFSRPRRRIDDNMLNLSLVFDTHREFKDLTFGEFFQALAPYRVKVAHAVTDSGDFINIDEYQWSLEIAPIANLADLVARQILIDEFELWRQVNKALGL